MNEIYPLVEPINRAWVGFSGEWVVQISGKRMYGNDPRTYVYHIHLDVDVDPDVVLVNDLGYRSSYRRYGYINTEWKCNACNKRVPKELQFLARLMLL
jgi:hypothetical protein